MNSVFDIFRASCGAFGDRPFLHLPAVARGPGAEADYDCTYLQALDQAAALAARYQGAGYGPGHRVGLALGNRPDFFFHWLAINKLGGAIVPLPGEATVQELAHILTAARPALVIVAEDSIGNIADAVAAAGSDIPVVSGESPLPDAPMGAGPATDTASAECAILFTSGSTGRPKACVLSNTYFTLFGDWYANLGELCALTPGKERLLTPLPLSHMNALACSTMGMIRTGGCLVQLDRFHPSTWWQTVADSGATAVHYLGVMPAILLALAEDPAERRHKVRFGFGAGCDPRHHAAFEERFGFPLVEGWAMTETGSGGCIMANREPRHVGMRCFGRPTDEVEIRILEEEGLDAAPGSPGELLVRAAGPDPKRGYFSGYDGDEAATRDIWRDGWLHTGDLVQQGIDGSLYFIDRKKAIIRRSGENVSAIEVEAALNALPGVRQSAVAPVADEIREQEVMACLIVDRPDGDKDAAIEILEALRAELSYFKLPGYIAFVDNLPLTASQKVNRGTLRLMCAALVEDGKAFDLRHLKKRTTAA